MACKNGDLATVEALLKPISDAELEEYYQSTQKLPQLIANRSISFDVEQRNFYGKLSNRYIFSFDSFKKIFFKYHAIALICP